MQRRQLNFKHPSLRGLLDALAALKTEHPALTATLDELSLVVDELVSNLNKYARSQGQSTRFELELQLLPDRIECALYDDGPAFNPFAAADPDLELPLEERPIGGLGLFLFRQLVHNGRYISSPEGNCTQFTLAAPPYSDTGNR